MYKEVFAIYINIFVLSLLFVSGIEDLFTRKVSFEYLIVFFIGTIVLKVFLVEISWEMYFGGMAIGICIVSLKYLGIQMLGAGDGVVLAISGAAIGFWKNMELLVIGLFLASLYGIGKFIKDGINCEKEIPFIPFLFLGYLIQVVWNGG